MTLFQLVTLQLVELSRR